MPFTIPLKKTGNTANRFAKIIFVWQENKAEVIRNRPVETTPLNQQYAFCLQQFSDKRLIVVDRIDFGIKLREHIERSLWLDAKNTGNGAD